MEVPAAPLPPLCAMLPLRAPAITVEGAEVELGRWCHVVGAYDGSVLRLYLDGALAGAVEVDNVVQGTPPESHPLTPTHRRSTRPAALSPGVLQAQPPTPFLSGCGAVVLCLAGFFAAAVTCSACVRAFLYGGGVGLPRPPRAQTRVCVAPFPATRLSLGSLHVR
jgi:hypothetical protein